MSATVEDLIKKINYIEMDMDLHKQILHAIPSDETDEMEKVLGVIADQKKQIQALRDQIKATDPAAHDRIVAIENGTRDFKALAQGKKFTRVDTPDEQGTCFITLTDGTRLDCLVAAQEEGGNWTVLTLEGEIKTYPQGLIK